MQIILRNDTCTLIILYRCRYCVDLRKLTRNDSNLDLVNAYAKFGEIPFICSQNIERKENSDSNQGYNSVVNL